MLVNNSILQKLREEFTFKGEQINYSKASRFLYGKYVHHNTNLKLAVDIIKKEEKEFLLKYTYNYSDSIWRVYSLSEKGNLICKTYNFTKLKHKLYLADLKKYIHYSKSYIDFINIITALNTLTNYISLTQLDLTDIRNLYYNLTNTLRETSIRKIFNSCSNLFRYLYPNNINPFKAISFKNIETMESSTPIIPPYVLKFLDNSREQIGDSYYLMYCFLRDTGLRFKEVLHFNSKDIVEQKGDYFKIRYKPFKIEKFMNEEYAYTFVHRTLIEEIYDTDYPFNFSLDSFNSRINKVLLDNKINWKFSSRQLRKTLATKLIENGATVHQVATQLNHLKYSTTEKYYIEIDKKNLAKKNSEFFLENAEIKECSVDNFEDCSFCSKLCTGTKYLEEWIKLYNEQLVKNDNPRLLQQYKIIIDKIKGV